MTRFTKQHYEEIASILAKSNNVNDVINRMCKYFKYDNERFDEQKFRTYIKKLRDNFGV